MKLCKLSQKFVVRGEYIDGYGIYYSSVVLSRTKSIKKARQLAEDNNGLVEFDNRLVYYPSVGYDVMG